jgi:hypothetical protein
MSYKPRPSSTVPFERDEIFVGRENIIKTIKNSIKGPGKSYKCAALVGLRCVG